MRYDRISLTLLCAFVFLGCVPKIDQVTPIQESDIRVDLEKELSSFTHDDAQLKTDWWSGYGDSQLDTIIEHAIVNAPTLKSVEARYAQANSITASVEAGNTPHISATSALTRQRYSENYIFPAPLGGGTYSLYQTGLTLDYDFDFWNARGSQILAAKYNALAQKAYIEASKLALSSAICETYLSWWFDEKRVATLSASKNTALEELSILNKKYKIGLVDAIKINDQKGGISKISQEILAVKRSIEGKKESICILGGFLPSYANTLKVPQIQESFKVPLPKEIYLNLIAHRADVTVQKYIVLSKSQNIEHAKAQFYPNISLSGLIGLTSFNWGKLFEHSSYAPMSGVAASLPLFDAGMRKANLQSNVSDYNSSVYDYNNAIIKAANEVVGVLKKTDLINAQQQVHQEDINAKNANETIARKKLSIGLTDKIPYLSAKIETYHSELIAINLEDEKSSLQIALIKALGGGYNDPEDHHDAH